MKKEDVKDILKKVDFGIYTLEEEHAAKLWLFQLNSDKELPLSEDKLNLASERMWAAIAKDTDSAQTYKAAPLWPRIAIAAAIAVIVFGAGLFYFSGHKQAGLPAQHDVASTDIAPGKAGATLTLANGKKISLSDIASGEITEEAGVTISKSTDGQLVYEVKGSAAELNKVNTLSTANAETYRVKLPDGSFVWLNAASSLTYSTALIEGGKRKVKLTGEAYFQVAKDRSHPFIVESRGQEIKVLGTQFNVNAYADEPVVATTLLEGAVELTAAGVKKVLKPGEQAANRKGSIEISQANIERVTDWKSGEFYVNHIDFKTAMRKIARWYDVEVIYNSSVPDDIEIGGWVSRDEKLSSVLKAIESAGLVRFTIEGRKIFVSK